MATNLVETRAPQEVWLSLEQVAETLALPWTTIRGWARDGDPRVPAYRVWDDTGSSRERFRFKKSDVEAFQARASAEASVASEPRAE